MPNFKGGRIVRKAEIDASSQAVTKEEPVGPMKEEMGMRQLLDGATGVCTHLLWDKETEDAILVNPVDTEVSRDLLVATSLNLVLAVNTHGLDNNHHISAGTRYLKQTVLGLKVVLCKIPKIEDDADLLLENDNILIKAGDEIHFGNQSITAIATPSPQTPGDMSFLLDDKKAVLTSATLLSSPSAGSGRCDVPATEALFLFALPDKTVVFPGFCFNDGPSFSNIGQEKKHNLLVGLAASMKDEPEVKPFDRQFRTRVKDRWGIFG